MTTLLISDIHGNGEKLEKILEREDFDSVLCAGDISDSNEYEDYERNLNEMLDILEGGSGLVKAVPGNMDPEETCVRALIDRKMNIHKKISGFGKFDVVGFGGGITPFGTPFEPSGEEIKSSVEILHDRMSSDSKIAVIHQPPKNTKLDIADGNHVGSEEVRQLIEEKDFDLVVTGHIHEARGTDKLGDTLLVNPGPVNQGYYALLNSENELDIEMKSL